MKTFTQIVLKVEIENEPTTSNDVKCCDVGRMTERSSGYCLITLHAKNIGLHGSARLRP